MCKECRGWVDAVYAEWNNPTDTAGETRIDDELFGAVYITVYFRKPYTVAMVSGEAVGTEDGVGVAKASYPDKWNIGRGEEIAIRRALKDFWKFNRVHRLLELGMSA